MQNILQPCLENIQDSQDTSQDTIERNHPCLLQEGEGNGTSKNSDDVADGLTRPGLKRSSGPVQSTV